MFGRKKREQAGAAEGPDGAAGAVAGGTAADEPVAEHPAAEDAAAGGNGPAAGTSAASGDGERGGADEPAQDRTDGPFDESEVDELDALAAEPRVLDLGSVLIPVPEGGQVQVELSNNGSVNGVFVTIAGGRVTMASFAAPKSPGQWRSVIGELAESVRNDGGTATIRTGRWGRELHASAKNGDVRFIGVDGPRWMLRGVAMGPAGSVGDDSELSRIARDMVAGAVVRRGDEPMPVRNPLPVTLPKALAEQLAQAQRQRAAQDQAQKQRQALQQLAQHQQRMSAALREVNGAGGDSAVGAGGPGSGDDGGPRQNPRGSAMQQLRNGSNVDEAGGGPSGGADGQ